MHQKPVRFFVVNLFIFVANVIGTAKNYCNIVGYGRKGKEIADNLAFVKFGIIFVVLYEIYKIILNRLTNVQIHPSTDQTGAGLCENKGEGEVYVC